MTIFDRIYREPAALIAFATAVLAVLTGTGVLTQAGATIALGVVAAAVGLLRYVVTPSSEVVVQERLGHDGRPHTFAGAALDTVTTGRPVVVDSVAAFPQDRTGNRPPSE